MSAYHLGVVGAGNMGSGIAQALVQKGLNVTLVDMNDELVERGMNRIRASLQKSVEKGYMKEEAARAALASLNGSSDYEDLKDKDLIIEAVFEDLSVKQEVFRKLDAVCSPKTIFASNTSSLSIADLASVTSRPDRVVGMHYFFPPARNKLLEIIAHAGTSEETARFAGRIATMHGKIAIHSKDVSGFAVNRYFVPFLTCAVKMLVEGDADIPTIEDAAKKAFHIGMGPFELMNVTGIPITLHSAESMEKAFGSFYAPPARIAEQIESGQPWDLSGEPDESMTEELIRLFYGVTLGVACEMVDEGVCSIRSCDIGAKVGLRWREGPFEMIDRLGTDYVFRCVMSAADRYPDFKVPENLRKLASGGGQPFPLDYVTSRTEDGIAYITINRPEAMNALNETVMNQLRDCFRAASDDPSVTAIAFAGEGAAFAAGADISFFVENIRNGTIDRIVKYTNSGQSLLREIETSRKPTIAVVEGLSLGGGTELALACQAIVAGPGASFGFPETGIGIYPGYGGMIRLARIIGKDLAKYFVMTGQVIRSEEAQKLGIITEMTTLENRAGTVRKLAAKGTLRKKENADVPGYEKEKQAMEKDHLKKILAGEIPDGMNPEFAARLVETLKKKAPVALRTVDRLMDEEEGLSVEDAIALEVSHLRDVFGTEDALTGLTAKRHQVPEFKGK